jgi:arylsulfatase A-like enzyme
LQWWKWFVGEGGIRVPMTILDYAGVEHPQTEFKDRKIAPPSSVSLRPYLAGKVPSPRTEEEWVAFELFGNKYVVAGDYKAIRVRPGMWGDGRLFVDTHQFISIDECPQLPPLPYHSIQATLFNSKCMIARLDPHCATPLHTDAGA